VKIANVEVEMYAMYIIASLSSNYLRLDLFAAM